MSKPELQDLFSEKELIFLRHGLCYKIDKMRERIQEKNPNDVLSPKTRELFYGDIEFAQKLYSRLIYMEAREK